MVVSNLQSAAKTKNMSVIIALNKCCKISARRCKLGRSEELAKARNILRQSFIANKQRSDVSWALDKLKELANRDSDISLEFECKRWNTMMTICKGGM